MNVGEAEESEGRDGIGDRRGKEGGGLGTQIWMKMSKI